MVSPAYDSMDDIEAIVRNQIPEGTSLEYKRSLVISNRDISSLCKSITAFANSAGGVFITGIVSKDGKPIELDGGINASSQIDWIYRIVSSNTYPPVETIDVKEFTSDTGLYYAILISRSPAAPHQSQDSRYYKRRGSHSEPMEHYEIEDVRNRPKIDLAPLSVSIVSKDQFCFIRIRNTSDRIFVKNARFSVHSNAEINRDNIRSICDRGLNQIAPGDDLFYIIESFNIMFGRNPDTEIRIEWSYNINESIVSDNILFHLRDIEDSIYVHSDEYDELKSIRNELQKISNELARFNNTLSGFKVIFDGTGLRISERNIQQLNGENPKFRPRDFDLDGYRTLLGISADDAFEIHNVFWTINSTAGRKILYDKLSEYLRNAFEERFKVEFD